MLLSPSEETLAFRSEPMPRLPRFSVPTPLPSPFQGKSCQHGNVPALSPSRELSAVKRLREAAGQPRATSAFSAARASRAPATTSRSRSPPFASDLPAVPQPHSAQMGVRKIFKKTGDIRYNRFGHSNNLYSLFSAWNFYESIYQMSTITCYALG